MISTGLQLYVTLNTYFVIVTVNSGDETRICWDRE